MSPAHTALLTQAITNFAQSYNGNWDKYLKNMSVDDMYEDACQAAPMTPQLYETLEAEWEEAGCFPDIPTCEIFDRVEMEVFGMKVSDFM